MSQPATSQQLSALERAVGSPLFVRSSSGVVPTERGRALYAEVAGALDQLESVMAGLDAGRLPESQLSLRFGSSAEYFSAEAVRHLARMDLNVVARFGPDDELIDQLQRGELDMIVTSTAPARRWITALPAGEKRFVLVSPSGLTPEDELTSLQALGSWLTDRPWVAFSQELPITRRFWQAHLGRPFPSPSLRLVAPDLRAVAAAVVEGVGCSLLPDFICAEPLAQGRMDEVYPVSELIPPEPWFVCSREGEASRPALSMLGAALRDASSE